MTTESSDYLPSSLIISLEPSELYVKSPSSEPRSTALKDGKPSLMPEPDTLTLLLGTSSRERMKRLIRIVVYFMMLTLLGMLLHVWSYVLERR